MEKSIYFTAFLRSDKKVKPTGRLYRFLTYKECRALPSHAEILDRSGRVATVKITSIKTWKTRPDLEIHCKFGLYEFFEVTVTPERVNCEFVKEITPDDLQELADALNAEIPSPYPDALKQALLNGTIYTQVIDGRATWAPRQK